MALALLLNPKGVTAQSPGLAPRLPWERDNLIPYPNGVSARSVRPRSTSEMKPRWGTRILVGSRGSTSMLGATPGFELQPLWGKAEGAKTFTAQVCSTGFNRCVLCRTRFDYKPGNHNSLDSIKPIFLTTNSRGIAVAGDGASPSSCYLGRMQNPGTPHDCH